MEETVTIVDRDILKVLAVDTRMDILKELFHGSRTPSDLSKMLKKSDSTIVEHLDTLIKAGLVKKIEQPGRKWIFYTLTDRGYGILSSKSRKLVIILVTSLISITGGFITSTLYSSQRFVAPNIGGAEGLKVSQNVVANVPQLYNYIPLLLFTIGVAGILFYSYQITKIKGALR